MSMHRACSIYTSARKTLLFYPSSTSWKCILSMLTNIQQKGLLVSTICYSCSVFPIASPYKIQALPLVEVIHGELKASNSSWKKQLVSIIHYSCSVFPTTSVYKIQALPLVEVIHGVEKPAKQTLLFQSTYTVILLPFYCSQISTVSPRDFSQNVVKIFFQRKIPNCQA